MCSGDHRKMCRLLVLYFCIPKMFNCRLSGFGCRGDVWGVCLCGGGRLSGSFHSLNLTILLRTDLLGSIYFLTKSYNRMRGHKSSYVHCSCRSAHVVHVLQ